KVQRALDFFSSEPMDWLELADMPTTGRRQGSDTTLTDGKVPTKCPPGAEVFAGLRTDKVLTDPEERERENGFGGRKSEAELKKEQQMQFAAAGARIAELPAIPAEERKGEQEDDLKKMRALRNKIQKQQAAGDFTPVEVAR